MIYISIIFFILALASFGFAGYYFYESTKKADKISKDAIDIISEGLNQQP